MVNFKESFKVDRRSSLGIDTLKDLLMINTNGVSMDNFNPDPLIDLWWKRVKSTRKEKSVKMNKK